MPSPLGEVCGMRIVSTEPISLRRCRAPHGLSDRTILRSRFGPISASVPEGRSAACRGRIHRLDEGPGGQNKWFFALGQGSLILRCTTRRSPPDFYLVRAPFSPVLGQWYHLAVTKTGTMFTIYVNGVAVGSEISPSPIANANAPLTIGEAESLGFRTGCSMRSPSTTAPSPLRKLWRCTMQEAVASASNCKSARTRVATQAAFPVHINGTGFQQGATVSLMMTGQPGIAGTPVTVGADGTTIDTTFNLTGEPRAAWDVVVTNPDGTSVTLPQGFAIQAGTEPRVWLDIVGIDLIEPRRAQPFQIFYGNSGNVDAVGVPLWIAGIPPTPALNWDLMCFHRCQSEIHPLTIAKFLPSLTQAQRSRPLS